MIAYYGDVSVRGADGYDSLDAFARRPFSSPLLRPGLDGRSGQGKLVLADRGYDINSFDLDDGNLTVRAGNLLGFAPTLELKQSIVPGFVTLLGTGKFLASSNGPVIFVDPPFRGRPGGAARLGRLPEPVGATTTPTGCAQSVRAATARWAGSGEERQYDFTGAGDRPVQSSEVVREDAALLKLVEQQTDALSPAQAGELGRRLLARSQQQRH